MIEKIGKIPKYWEYEGEILEYNPNDPYFTTKDGGKVPIIKVWQDGFPVDKEEK